MDKTMKKYIPFFDCANLKSWKPEYDSSYILPEFKIDFNKCSSYWGAVLSRRHVNSGIMRLLYNKKKIKDFFSNRGLNVPNLYFYSKEKADIRPYLKEKYVAKPAHLSESDFVFINDKNHEMVNEQLNLSLTKSPRDFETQMMKETEKGILVEEWIDYEYELKVFVLWGCPIVGDLRTSNNPRTRIDMIDKNNKYFNWDREYEICKKIAKDIKIDFIRIDFYYSKKENKLFAGEVAFKPGGEMGPKINDYIYERWRR